MNFKGMLRNFMNRQGVKPNHELSSKHKAGKHTARYKDMDAAERRKKFNRRKKDLKAKKRMAERSRRINRKCA